MPDLEYTSHENISAQCSKALQTERKYFKIESDKRAGKSLDYSQLKAVRAGDLKVVEWNFVT